MSNSYSSLRDEVKWVRMVNSRWIVHEGLDVTTRDYLDHLEVTDPDRLRRSCKIAYRMAKSGVSAEDPKPRFYGGLYALATPEEAKRYLENYRYIASLHPGSKPEPYFGKGTLEKIHALREQICHFVREVEQAG